MTSSVGVVFFLGASGLMVKTMLNFSEPATMRLRRHFLLGGVVFGDPKNEDLREETWQHDPSIKFLSRQICDGLVLCEVVARLKQKRRRD